MPDHVWTNPYPCDQEIVFSRSPSAYRVTCDAFALQYNIPSAALEDLNDNVDCNGLEDITICAPLLCQVRVVDDITRSSPQQFIQDMGNLTLTQFMSWNPSAGMRNLQYGEVVCIG